MGCTSSTQQKTSQDIHSVIEITCLDKAEEALNSFPADSAKQKNSENETCVSVGLKLNEGFSVLLSHSISNERAILSILVNDEINTFVAVKPRRISIAPTSQPLNVYLVIVPSLTFDGLQSSKSVGKVCFIIFISLYKC